MMFFFFLSCYTGSYKLECLHKTLGDIDKIFKRWKKKERENERDYKDCISFGLPSCITCNLFPLSSESANSLHWGPHTYVTELHKQGKEQTTKPPNYHDIKVTKNAQQVPLRNKTKHRILLRSKSVKKKRNMEELLEAKSKLKSYKRVGHTKLSGKRICRKISMDPKYDKSRLPLQGKR